ncbi:hypothetical protein VK792_14550 [Mesobacterium sp. TK19101]|uniref:Uncharacterized protein n=1 Tax=Mesobacterium hydrothermale TaxID=3111907 RepID=A0ABU6HKY8_9RHOB|nr:hypothetical protein [Mesobacterium sp. TK19101]MEC3862510.1 hypothetical protein [Mesobacterium sp. TK19101]
MFRTCLALLLTLFAAGVSQAATVTKGDSRACPARLTGAIAAGDLEKVKALDGVWPEPLDPTTAHQVVCLDSPGGSFAEAMRIAAHFYDVGIGTRLPEGAQCLSACAVLFMSGTRYFYEGVGNGRSSHRNMHFTAQLGFHRPQLSLGRDGQFDAAAVERSFDLAVDASLEFIRLSNGRNGQTDTMVPADLIERMFSHRGDDFFFITTTGMAGRWRIGIDGWQVNRVLGPAQAVQVCDNLTIWNSRYDPNDTTLGPAAARPYAEPNARVGFRVSGSRFGDGVHECMVGFDGPVDDPWMVICGASDIEGNVRGADRCAEDTAMIEPFNILVRDMLAILPPATPLAAINAVSRQQDAEAGQSARSDPTSAQLAQRGCWFNAPGARIINVQEFVNLRQLPGFDTQVVSQIARGASVTLTNPGSVSFLGASDLVQRCSRACQTQRDAGLSAAVQGELAHCVEGNALWYAVRDAAGNQGMSRASS